MSAALGNCFRFWQAALAFTGAWQHQLSREFGKISTASGSHRLHILHPHHDPSSAQQCLLLTCCSCSLGSPRTETQGLASAQASSPLSPAVVFKWQQLRAAICPQGPYGCWWRSCSSQPLCWQVWRTQAMPLAGELLPSLVGVS